MAALHEATTLLKFEQAIEDFKSTAAVFERRQAIAIQTEDDIRKNPSSNQRQLAEAEDLVDEIGTRYMDWLLGAVSDQVQMIAHVPGYLTFLEQEGKWEILEDVLDVTGHVGAADNIREYIDREIGWGTVANAVALSSLGSGHYYRDNNPDEFFGFEECAICLTDVNAYNFTCGLECGHTFHASCMENVVDYRCPLCRQPFK